MGKHSIRGCITGEELNVVRNYSDSYRPRHSKTPVDSFRMGSVVEVDEPQSLAEVVQLNRFQRTYGDYGFGVSW